MSAEIIKVPELGGVDTAEVIEVCVSAGDVIGKEDSLVVLESDKASMDVPSPRAGKILAVLVKEGDSIGEGDQLVEIEVEQEAGETNQPEKAEERQQEDQPDSSEAKQQSAPQAAELQDKKTDESTQKTGLEQVPVPEIGTDEAVEVIEICVAEGDQVEEGSSLVVLESDKASMEVPSPMAGTVRSIKLKEGDSVRQGDLILEVETASAAKVEAETDADDIAMPTPAADARQHLAEPKQVSEKYQQVTGMTASRPSGDVYAGPAVRKMAREVGLDLALVPGSGPKGRIQKDDVKAFIKDALVNKRSVLAAGSGIPAVPDVDFSQFGEVSIEKMSKLHKLTAANMHRSWLNVPHVTGFDDIDITDLEAFRKELKAEAEKEGIKVTPLPFLLKACAIALKANPRLNASLHNDGESVVFKHYVHIGVAVDTPAGLMVPVVRDVDKKSIYELAAETAELAQKARERKLKPAEMQGGTFTVSSLGAMGGTGFTPIINTPEVAILGVSRLDIKPRWNGETFEPRKMLPVSLSYDHRMVNGADAGRFMVQLNSLMSDVRRIALS